MHPFLPSDGLVLPQRQLGTGVPVMKTLGEHANST